MKKKFPKRLKHGHQAAEIRQRLGKSATNGLGKDVVYGGVDGVITTFAVVAGVEGAQLDPKISLILGMANLLADGFSMAASNYLAVRTENEEKRMLREYEREQIKSEPHGEREEIKQIFEMKGFEGELLDKATEQVVKDENLWLDTMISEEYGLNPLPTNPLRPALATFTSFLIFGSIPLMPFIFKAPNQFTVGTFASLFAFFLIGSLKSRWSVEKPFVSGLKTMALGACAAFISYYIGKILGDLA